jgi:hypothetical protein
VSRTVLVVGGDLMARERIRSAAASSGAEVSFASFADVVAALENSSPDLVILDLDDGREPLLNDVVEARSQGLLPDRVLGYYSHVDAGLGQAAVDAGVEPIRRGVFWATLPDLLSAP